MGLAERLRELLRMEASLNAVAFRTGIPQPTLHDFAVGRRDGSFSDLRLSAAEKLMEFYGLNVACSNRSTADKENRKMRLARELRLAGVEMQANDFKEYLISWLIEWCPSRTIDSLVCEPRDAMEYCRRVRDALENDKLIDYVILKALMNQRRASQCPRNLSPRRIRVATNKLLAEAGCELTPQRFEAVLVDAVPGVCKDKTVDDLCCYADQAAEYCERVRRLVNCPTLKDSAILRSLMNHRKTLKERGKKARA